MEAVMRGMTVKHPNFSPPSVTDVWAKRHRLRFAVSRISSASVIAVRGEVDACNAGEIGEYAASHLGHSSQLLLDLSEVDFFGTPGISALHKLNVECAQRGIAWIVVAAPQVSRVLQICDPEGVLPVTNSESAGLAALANGRHLQLLSARPAL
jgi:anti-anti-sigma factor